SSSVKLTFRVGMTVALPRDVDFEFTVARLAKIANSNNFLPAPSILGALASISCDHQFRCGCRGPWRNLFEGDELSSTQKLTHSRKPDRRSGSSRQER